MASTQSPMFSTAMSPLISRAPSPYLPQSQASSYPLENEGYHNTLPSLESLSANLVTPIEGFRSRALRPMSRPMTSSFAPNLLSSFAPLRMRSRFDSSSTMSSFRPLRREQNYPSLLTLPRRSHFRHSLHYGRFPHWRKFSRRPLYREKASFTQGLWRPGHQCVALRSWQCRQRWSCHASRWIHRDRWQC